MLTPEIPISLVSPPKMIKKVKEANKICSNVVIKEIILI